MRTVYFWTGTAVVEVGGFISPNDRAHCGQFCIDTGVPADSHTGRYGRWGPDIWVDLSYNELPKEFRVALLLLGVS